MQQSTTTANRFETIKTESLLLLILFVFTGIIIQLFFTDRLIMENSSMQIEILTSLVFATIVYLITRIIFAFGSFLFSLRIYFGLIFISLIASGFYHILVTYSQELYIFLRVLVGDSWIEFFLSRTDWFTGEFHYLCRMCALLFFWWLILFIVFAPFFITLFILKFCFSKILRLFTREKSVSDMNQTIDNSQNDTTCANCNVYQTNENPTQVSSVDTPALTSTANASTSSTQKLKSEPVSNKKSKPSPTMSKGNAPKKKQTKKQNKC